MLLDKNSARSLQPINANIKLKPHQLAMLQRCKDIEMLNKGYGIMADKPGAGKTFVMLSLVLNDQQKEKSIVVVPHNIYNQWIEAIQTFSPCMKYVSYVNYQDITDLYFTKQIPECDIIITTALYYHTVTDSLHESNNRVKRVFLDEVDSIDNVLTKKVACDTLWLVSASYHKSRIENLSGVIESFNEDEILCICEESFQEQSFSLESPKLHNYICRSSFLNLMLRDIIDDKEMKAAYASDFSLIQRHIFTDIANNEKQAVLFVLKDLEMTLDSETVKLVDYTKKGANITPIEQVNKDLCESLIRDCQGKLKEIHQRIETYKLCVGCMEKYTRTGTYYTSSCCNKNICSKCIDKWYNHTLYCPYCRMKPDITTHTEMHSNIEESDTCDTCDYVSQDKMETFMKLIKQTCGNKVIVFSDYSKVFTSIQNRLKREHIIFVELDGGNINDMQKILNAYRHGSVKVLLVNSSFYGCGMNLENTTDVIFYHKTETVMYKQVIGRAQRPGRTSCLNVHNLLYLQE